MSKISLKPNASGTGVFSLEAPNSNTDRTLNLPDEAGTVLTNVSDISAANLTGDVAAERITGALNATGTAPVYACRAWVNFDGTGTVSIRDSGNVSSITDNGIGRYTVNFATAMPDTDYCLTGTASLRSIDDPNTMMISFRRSTNFSITTTNAPVMTSDQNSTQFGNFQDPNIACAAFFR